MVFNMLVNAALHSDENKVNEIKGGYMFLAQAFQLCLEQASVLWFIEC